MLRWNKGDEFIKIERVTSVDDNREVFIIATNLPWAVLPLEFKEKVPVLNGAASASLRETVASWARSNGFTKAGA